MPRRGAAVANPTRSNAPTQSELSRRGERANALQLQVAKVSSLLKYRPSNSRIKQLEEENARLRGSSQASNLHNAQQPSNTTETVEQTPAWGHSSPTPHRAESDAVEGTLDLPDEPQTATPVQDVVRHPSPTVTRRYTTSIPDRDNRFHGPSSAMFDGLRSSNKPLVDFDTPDDVYKKCQLMAEATRQSTYPGSSLLIQRRN